MNEHVRGILKAPRKKPAFLHDSASAQTVFVPADLIRSYDLPEGATIVGSSRAGRQGAELTTVETICGLTPDRFRERTPFRELTAIDPDQRFNLAVTGDPSTRLVDLVAPIGKGTRGLIVAPPKAGKTMLLERIAAAIRVDDPETRLVVLLIDERPEEVTHFRRAIDGAEVFASSSDQPPHEHVQLIEFMLAHIRLELECGHDVVVLLDGLTRLVRAFNLRGSGVGAGRTLSGGLQADALQIPRRFFGLARNIENGGSVTILSTVLVDTGSRMDQAIFEEFKGTGNSEIVLDRSLAEAYIFPALDLVASGTRKEDRLYGPEDSLRLAKLRRELAGRPPREGMLAMLDLLAKYPTNEELLQAIAI
jgi:transcription termination factor Rho